jgi:hypothetical protein
MFVVAVVIDHAAVECNGIQRACPWLVGQYQWGLQYVSEVALGVVVRSLDSMAVQ